MIDPDAPECIEFRALGLLQGFGTDAVYGRPLSMDELQRLSIARSIRDAYRDRERSGNYAEWSNKYPKASRLLNRAMRAYEVLYNE